MVTSVARLAVPAEGVDSLVRKEYFNGCIATALKLQGAPGELHGVIENEIDSRTDFENSESED